MEMRLHVLYHFDYKTQAGKNGVIEYPRVLRMTEHVQTLSATQRKGMYKYGTTSYGIHIVQQVSECVWTNYCMQIILSFHAF